MKIGYLPLVSKGGGVVGEVFEWTAEAVEGLLPILDIRS